MKTYQTAVPLRYQNKRYFAGRFDMALERVMWEMQDLFQDHGIEAAGKPKGYLRYTAVLDEATLEHRYDLFLVLEQKGRLTHEG